VLDFADLSSEHKIFSLATLGGIPATIKSPKKKTTDGEVDDFYNPYEVSHQLEALMEQAPWVDITKIEDLSQVAYAAYDVNFFANAVPYEICQWTENQYVALPDGSYRMILPNSTGEIIIRPDLIGFEVTGFENIKDQGKRAIKRFIYQDSFKTLRMAVLASDALVRRWQPDALRVLSTKATWRQEPVSERQGAILKAHGFSKIDHINRGQASMIMSSIMSRKSSTGNGRFAKY
jgi:hypothetical protein